MAPPVKATPPATLPGNFFDNQQSAPDTLPGDFKFEDQAVLSKQFPAPTQPDERNGLQRAFDKATTVTPEQEKIPSWMNPAVGNVINKAQEFGAGAIQGAGQPFVHPLDTLSGIGSSIAHPIEAAKAMGKGAMEHPFQTAGNLVGGAVTAGGLEELPGGGIPFKSPAQGPGTLGRVMDAIPTRAKAGKLFESVMNDAGDQPVNLTRAMDPLERAQQLSARGHGTVSAADNLYKRINTVNPLDYREARDWASSLSRLSGEDSMSASPALKAQIGKLSHAFNEDVGDTAGSVGRGEDYTKAMQDYARASSLRNAAVKGAKIAIPVAVGAGVAGKLAHTLLPK
jgi:hypothetical protein